MCCPKISKVTIVPSLQAVLEVSLLGAQECTKQKKFHLQQRFVAKQRITNQHEVFMPS